MIRVNVPGLTGLKMIYLFCAQYFLFVFCCHAKDIPKRELIINKYMPGISIVINIDKKIIYPLDTDDKLSETQMVILPQTRDIELNLEDQTYAGGHDRFSLKDVVALSKQTPLAFQFLTISHCDNEALLEDIMKVLRNQEMLKEAYFFRCVLSENLYDILGQSKTLRRLVLDSCENNVTEEQNNCFKDSNVTSLYLSATSFTHLMQNISLLKRLNELYVAKLYLDQSDFGNIKSNTSIKIARFVDVTFQKDNEPAAVSVSDLVLFKNLEELDLSIKDGRIKSFSFLSKLKNLRILTLENGGLRRDDLKYLQGIDDLRELSLGLSYNASLKNYEELTGDDMKFLLSLKNLRLLKIKHARITDDARKLITSMKNLKIENNVE